MAASIKQYLSDIWFDFQYGDYDFAGDLNKLTVAKLKQKYIPLVENPRFFRKFILKNKDLLHRYISDKDKALFLVGLGYSLLDLNADQDSPIQYYIKQNKRQDKQLLDTVYAIVLQTKFSNKKLIIYEEDLSHLTLRANKEKHKFATELANQYGCTTRGSEFNDDDSSVHSVPSSSSSPSISLENSPQWKVTLSEKSDARGEIIGYFSDRKHLLDEEKNDEDNLFASAPNHEIATPITRVKIKRADTLAVNQKENRAPKIQGAIGRKDHVGITQMIAEGANPFEENAQGWNAFEYCIRNGYQEEFNHLIDQTFNSPLLGSLLFLPKFEKRSGNPCVSAKQLLNYITNTLQTKGEYDHHLLSFLWKYLVEPLYEQCTKEEQLTLAYFFKNVHILLSITASEQDKSKISEQNITIDDSHLEQMISLDLTATASPTTATADIKDLLCEVKQLLKLSEQKTMMSLNTCRHWRGLGGGLGQSTLNTKLQEMRGVVQVALGNNPSGSTLSEKLDNILRTGGTLKQAHVSALNRLVLEIKHVSNVRSKQYQTQDYVRRLSPSIKV